MLQKNIKGEYTSEVANNDEHPLVIDEEKPAEEGDGNNEENEKEFEPKVDMISFMVITIHE